MTAPIQHALDASKEYVTVFIANQAFGVPVTEIHDVFAPIGVTHVPLGPREIAGILNLRGRIVTIIDARARLALPAREPEMRGMAVGLERGGESYGLLVDSVGEVLRLNDADMQSPPGNLDARWQAVCAGVFRLEKRLLIILDLDHMLDFGRAAA